MAFLTSTHVYKARMRPRCHRIHRISPETKLVELIRGLFHGIYGGSLVV